MSIVQYNSKTPSTTYTVRSDDSLEVPQIDVCIPYRFDKAKINRYEFDEQMLDVLQLSFVSTYQKKFSTTLVETYLTKSLRDYVPELLHAESAIVEKLARLNTTLDAFIDEVSFKCVDIVKMVYIGESAVEVDEACEWWSQSLRTILGHCVRFSAVKQGFDGPGTARTYRFVVPVERAVNTFRAPYNGLTVRVVPDQPDVNLVYVPFNARTNVKLQLTKGKYMRTAANPCEEVRAENATRMSCMYACLVERMFPDCDCRPYDSEGYVVEKPVCTPSRLIGCFLKGSPNGRTIKVNQTYDPASENMKRCAEACPQYCQIDRYTVSTTTMILNGDQILDHSGNGMTQPEKEAVLDVHYESLLVVEINQFPSMTFESLVANIGGLLGLWIGGSAIALVHLVYFWITRLREAAVDR